MNCYKRHEALALGVASRDPRRFPIGGCAANIIVGKIDSVGAALLGGLNEPDPRD